MAKILPKTLYAIRETDDEGTEDEYDYLVYAEEGEGELEELLTTQPNDEAFVGVYQLVEVRSLKLHVRREVETVAVVDKPEWNNK